MAIVPSSKYPAQTLVSDPSGYPYGKARNVVTAGDGSGTPWEADLVNDLFGFLQSLLVGAGITPSNTPDKVGTSQYLDAIAKVIEGENFVWSGSHAFGGAVSVGGDIAIDPAMVEWRCLNLTRFAFSFSGANPPSVSLGAGVVFSGTAGNSATGFLPIELPTGTTFDAVRLGYHPTADNDTSIQVIKSIPNTSTGSHSVSFLSSVVTVPAGSATAPVTIPLTAPETVDNSGAFYYLFIGCGAQATASSATLHWAQVHATYNAITPR
jgi:hypothetical protein